MAHTPEVIKIDVLMRVHGATEVHQVATVDLPVTYQGNASAQLDPGPIADAGDAIADAMRKVLDDHA
ncbi:hypothetical protein [Nocardia sp. No.11]|uniref:hypothetical protein n=1 Tax=Nocardia sp. No.11 TaxID=3128861 RepID=UPI00319DC1A9